jgi:hypothetical protein
MDCQAAVQVVVLADLIDVQDFLVVYNIPWNLFRSNGLFGKLSTFFCENSADVIVIQNVVVDFNLHCAKIFFG